MAYYAQKDPDLQATEKIYRKIMSTGREPGRFTSPSPHSSVGRKSGHPTPRRTAETGRKSVSSSSRGGNVLAEKQMNRHFPDPSEAALKRTHDGATTHRSLSPASTVRTGRSVSNKKRAVYNSHSPAKTPTGQLKGEKHLTGVPFEKKILDVENSDRWNLSYQALRLEKEWTELDTCRNMKRNSEIVRHRVDKMYMMSGSGIRLKPKYDVSEDELQQLKDLSQARQVLREKGKKNLPTPKGRKSNMEKEKNRKNAKKEGTQPEIHINGDAQRNGSGTDHQQPSADWASESGSRPQPSPNGLPSDNQENGDKENIEGDNDKTEVQAKENGELEENQEERSRSQEVEDSEVVKEQTADDEKEQTADDEKEQTADDEERPGSTSGEVVEEGKNGEGDVGVEQITGDEGQKNVENVEEAATGEPEEDVESRDRTDVKYCSEGGSEMGGIGEGENNEVEGDKGLNEGEATGEERQEEEEKTDS